MASTAHHRMITSADKPVARRQSSAVALRGSGFAADRDRASSLALRIIGFTLEIIGVRLSSLMTFDTRVLVSNPLRGEL